MNPRCKVGDKIKFAEEKAAYTVQAMNDRYAVCTKPFNPARTVWYTIIDFEEEIRGPENLVFGFGAETRELCEEMLARIVSGESEISHRSRIELRQEVIPEQKEKKP